MSTTDKKIQWDLALVDERQTAPATMPKLFGGSPASREERDVVRKFTLDTYAIEGTSFKIDLAAHHVHELERGAFMHSVGLVDFMLRERDAIANAEVRDFARQLAQKLGGHHANVQVRLVDIAAGRLTDIAGRDIGPDPEPEREPTFWERVFGG